MMQCLIYSQGELIGEATFTALDSGMGVVYAPFHPNQNYDKISPLIREFSLLGSFADINATEETRLHAEEVFRRLQALELQACTLAGEDTDPAGGVSIEDFSEEFEDDPCAVTLLGLPRSICEKYFND